MGTAGSIGLLLQCITPISAYAGSQVSLRIRGGTAVRWSPPIRILDNVVWGALREIGFEGSLEIEREGYCPRGGGIVEATIKPVRNLTPLIA